MALVEYSGNIASISGHIGGTIYQHSAAGNTARTKCAPVNKNTPRQNLTRNITFQLQQEWALLTEDQRDTWEGYTRYQPLAQQRNPGRFINGHQAFLKLNHNRLQYGFPVLAEPDFNKCNITPVDADLSLVGPNLTITLDRALVPADEFIILFVTQPLRVTWNSPRGLLKLLIFVTTVGPAINIASEFTALFGAAATSGDTLFFRFSNADLNSGFIFPYKTKKVTL